MDLRLRLRRRKPPEGLGAALSLTLTALKESADAFPPLKSVVGAVVHIRDLRLVGPLAESSLQDFFLKNPPESQIKP